MFPGRDTDNLKKKVGMKISNDKREPDINEARDGALVDMSLAPLEVSLRRIHSTREPTFGEILSPRRAFLLASVSLFTHFLLARRTIS